MHPKRVEERVVAADRDQHVDPAILDYAERMWREVERALTGDGVREKRGHVVRPYATGVRARRVQERAARAVDRPYHTGVERQEPLVRGLGPVGVVVEEAGPAAPDADDLVPFARDAVDHGLDGRVETRHVAASRQDSDPQPAASPSSSSFPDAGGGTRTHTPSRTPDFESGASTSSATPAGSLIVLARPMRYRTSRCPLSKVDRTATEADTFAEHVRELRRRDHVARAPESRRRIGLKAKRAMWFLALLVGALAFVAAGCGGDDEGGGGSVEALPSSSCTAIEYEGDGDPDDLIASDLPLQGASRLQSLQINAAIRQELKNREWKAGDYNIGFQACDDATAQAAKWDSGKCSQNANAYAANDKLVGVVGTFNSGCAAIIIPVLNQAPDGGIAMVSPANTYAVLDGQPAGRL